MPLRGQTLPLEMLENQADYVGMPDEQPSLHIDTDWKTKAREEKKKLAEEQKKKAEAAAVASLPATMPGIVPPADPRASAAGRGREALSANFPTLVQSVVTQALFYMGDLTPRGAEPQLNLDMAKHQLDILGVIEDKTKNNLSADEQRMLDAALYETRMRFVGIASQVING